ncbi:hypothetical protein OVA11_14135 [Caulobacter sp. SL161]|uniref:hypothetical protein n=1 Tax=Caulobacter sp. SL161 TaxID=2995156 RepID=UPI002274E2A3|nr:hypothetical protein [Caulobacter sp. SL161]MCY1648159.1 hypothetical protein [Caulobacter sp. SL161]
MTALVAEKSRRVGETFADRIARAVELLDGEVHGMGRHLLVAYATARVLGEDTREAMLRAHFGKDFREPRAGWNLPYIEGFAVEWDAYLDAATARIRAKAVRS